MKKIYIFILLGIISPLTYGQLILNTQFINPCGGDERNEFIVARIAQDPVNIADICFGSYSPSSGEVDYNYWWAGTNAASNPYPVFSNFTPEVCGTGDLKCFGFRYPSVAADATDIDDLINQLNTAAGCHVFLPVPSTNTIPANSNVVIFVAAGFRNANGLCGFDDIAGNLNFNNHCNNGAPIATYYVVFGNGSSGANCNISGGYFSNSSRRVSTLHTFKGGDNTVASNYISSYQDYTPGNAPSTGNAGLIAPNAAGNGFEWVNNQGCVPAPNIIVPVKFEYFRGTLNDKTALLTWKTSFEENIKTFIIERSFNGKDFSTYKTVAPRNLSGSEYTLMDDALAGGYNYYRLKVINLDGTIDYSYIVKINFTRGAPASWYISPNPSDNSASVIYKSTTSKIIYVNMFDVAGRQVSSNSYKTVAGNNKINLLSEKLSKGTYIITVGSGENKETAVFIKK
ncbi:MAG: T9SS type A sorting domain-containing protein [Ferruginibacter sp.]